MKASCANFAAWPRARQLNLICCPIFATFRPSKNPLRRSPKTAQAKRCTTASSPTEIVLADDSGLVVPALGGAPGVHSARYAGPNATDADRIDKLLTAMQGVHRETSAARASSASFRWRSAAAPIAVVSDFVAGLIATKPQGAHGFGYDPIFFSPELGRTFAEASEDEKNRISHRGKAFRKVLELLQGSQIL